MPASPTIAIRPCKRGHFARRNTQGKCVECVKIYGAKFRQKRPGYQTEYMRGYRATRPEKMLLQYAKDRARRDGYPCTIAECDISIPEFCPLLDIKLERGAGVGGVRPSSPTLDKIKPELGYVPGNVWVISARANTLKNDATLEELEMLVARLRDVAR
mgnify:CR=1 FL=1